MTKEALMLNDQAEARNKAVLLTAPGSGAIAVVRIIGPGVTEFLKAHFSAQTTVGRCVHGDVIDDSNVIDDVVVVLAPDRFFADINLHGGPWVIRSFLDLLRRSGFQISDHITGALPDGALDGGTTLEREMLAHLPLAHTELAIRTLLAQPNAWSAFLNGQSAIGNGQSAIAEILADCALDHLLHPPRVAIIGIPNVGKSTLANQLFAQERSITADRPGTTRDWIGEFANIDGLPVLLVDTPGLRESSDAIERLAIGRSAEQIAKADVVLLVLDPTQPLAPQEQLLNAHPAAIAIINKSDLAPIWELPSAGGLHIVATTGHGVNELRTRIRRHFGCDDVDPNRPRCWTDRQRHILNRAISDPSSLAEMLT